MSRTRWGSWAREVGGRAYVLRVLGMRSWEGVRGGGLCSRRFGTSLLEEQANIHVKNSRFVPG